MTRKANGFTLLELLICLVIIVILVAIGTKIYNAVVVQHQPAPCTYGVQI